MKLGIYAIFRDEAPRMKDWMESVLSEVKEGDSITLVDTGSVDGGGVTAREAWKDRTLTFDGVVFKISDIAVRPWRFDVALNTALALVPGDVDFAWRLDLDERPRPGWRQVIEEAAQFKPEAERIRYQYAWSESHVYWSDRLHKRHGVLWRGIAHEQLYKEGGEKWDDAFAHDLHVVHMRDESVDRKNRDMELMKRAIAESPYDPITQFYYARANRDLALSDKSEEAATEAARWFMGFLQNPATATMKHYRIEAMLFMATYSKTREDYESWLLRAVAEDPTNRKAWMWLGKWQEWAGNASLALGAAVRAKNLPGRTGGFLDDSSFDGDAPIEMIRRIRKNAKKRS